MDNESEMEPVTLSEIEEFLLHLARQLLELRTANPELLATLMIWSKALEAASQVVHRHDRSRTEYVPSAN